MECLAKRKDNQIFTNGGIEYASILMSVLFDDTVNEVKMYCRRLAPALTTNETYFGSFSKLLERGRKLKLLVETTDYISDPAFEKVVSGQRARNDNSIEFRKIKIEDKKVINSRLIENCNFSVFDNEKYRVETNPSEYKAFGSFNDKDVASILTDLFDEAFNNADPIVA